jgi:hypothetical protein
VFDKCLTVSANVISSRNTMQKRRNIRLKLKVINNIMNIVIKINYYYYYYYYYYAGVGGRIISICIYIFMKWGGEAWTGLIWLEIATSAGLL